MPVKFSVTEARESVPQGGKSGRAGHTLDQALLVASTLIDVLHTLSPLARLQLRCHSLDSSPEGEIIRSSSWIKFGAGSITLAGAGSGFGHSIAGGGTGGSDVQPLAPSINISP